MGLFSNAHRSKKRITRRTRRRKKRISTLSRPPADIFGVKDRGYVKEGFFADLVVVDPSSPYSVNSSNLLSKCQWSPFEGHEFSASIDTTIVNGDVVYRDGQLTGIVAGQKLEFGRAR
jgi:dihydroorotase